MNPGGENFPAGGPPAATAWALRLPARDAGALARLRLFAGVEIGETADGAEIWLRGGGAEAGLAEALRAVPATARYTQMADGRLRPFGALLAVERLPELAWQPLRAWLRVAPPVARLPAGVPPPVRLVLTASHDARAANAALVPLGAWLDWMLAAPALRIARLRFAASADGRALVLGAPLPALPCRACVEEAGVVVPAGLAWQPAVSAGVVRRTLRVPDGAVVLWDETGMRVLAAELFVPASRGAARATRAARETPIAP